MLDCDGGAVSLGLDGRRGIGRWGVGPCDVAVFSKKESEEVGESGIVDVVSKGARGLA